MTQIEWFYFPTQSTDHIYRDFQLVLICYDAPLHAVVHIEIYQEFWELKLTTI